MTSREDQERTQMKFLMLTRLLREKDIFVELLLPTCNAMKDMTTTQKENFVSQMTDIITQGQSKQEILEKAQEFLLPRS